MKKLILIAILGISQFMAAQVSQNLGDFTVVRAFDRINITLKKSTENKIDIRGNQAENVEVVNKNGELKVRMKVSKMFNGDNIEAVIYYTGKLDRIEASEGASISSSDKFSATAFELSAKEGAIISLKLDVDKLTTRVNSGGLITVQGKATNHDVTMTSGATLKAEELKTSQTEITLNAGGKADITATDYVNAKTRAGGDIRIHGQPKQVDQKTIAGGNINIVK
ncbi:head GIN domain-containing protein [Flavobacterium sp. RHBU_3]|uniref:head GIN domain-containing protein n=1 Tax=Flavobacterium sp. RHBU_3 TaxID=3391184 RepID=UPI0039850FAA